MSLDSLFSQYKWDMALLDWCEKDPVHPCYNFIGLWLLKDKLAMEEYCLRTECFGDDGEDCFGTFLLYWEWKRTVVVRRELRTRKTISLWRFISHSMNRYYQDPLDHQLSYQFVYLKLGIGYMVSTHYLPHSHFLYTINCWTTFSHHPVIRSQLLRIWSKNPQSSINSVVCFYNILSCTLPTLLTFSKNLPNFNLPARNTGNASKFSCRTLW